jgi:hypothetical protein
MGFAVAQGNANARGPMSLPLPYNSMLDGSSHAQQQQQQQQQATTLDTALLNLSNLGHLDSLPIPNLNLGNLGNLSSLGALGGLNLANFDFSSLGAFDASLNGLAATPASEQQQQQQAEAQKAQAQANAEAERVSGAKKLKSLGAGPAEIEEDKRRRNTEASARFRAKKKERESALEIRASMCLLHCIGSVPPGTRYGSASATWDERARSSLTIYRRTRKPGRPAHSRQRVPVERKQAAQSHRPRLGSG